MPWQTFSMPAGLPASLWFFVATAFVYLLQRFPLTGVFLMIVGGALWSILLINAGMAGIAFEAATGKVSTLWLLIPALYVGGYYAAYFHDQKMFGVASRETLQFNDGKSLPFDPAKQDLLLEDPGDGLGLSAAPFLEKYGLARVFDSHGRVYQVGMRDTCTLIHDTPAFRTADIQFYFISRPGPSRWRKTATDYCVIIMPGAPDKPVVRIAERAEKAKFGGLSATARDFTAYDDSSGSSAVVRSGRAGTLKRFPMPIMGCALNSGAPAWECFHGFMRDTVELVSGMARYEASTGIVANMLGLKEVDNLGAHAIGPEHFKPIADRIDAETAARELGVLEAMLTDPETPVKDGWFRHLLNRPELVAPNAGRIFNALETLQASTVRGSENGRNLWRLVEVLPEDALAPHRSKMVEWLKAGSVKPWTEQAWQVMSRLDVADAVQRNIVLTRIENPRGDLPASLLAPFCRMGAGAPPDAKSRLLAVWKARGAVAAEREANRGSDHIQLYLTLARMGLKEKAGKVEQRYMGDTFAGIWNEVTPESSADICGLSENDLRNRFRRL